MSVATGSSVARRRERAGQEILGRRMRACSVRSGPRPVALYARLVMGSPTPLISTALEGLLLMHGGHSDRPESGDPFRDVVRCLAPVGTKEEAEFA